MKRIYLLAAALGAGVALTISCMLIVQRMEVAAGPPSIETVRINLGIEPSSIDPALASDIPSISVIEQLFLGLVDLDDATSDVYPELATSWEISDGGDVYTFTLRSDVTWSDGNPVTAEDVRYGLLRTLNPDTGSSFAHPLYIIAGAEDYATGVVTDTTQVGVTTIDTATLRIDLAHPAGHALAVFSMWVARPVPRWAIEAHGSPTWTEASNMVTNGAYRLAEWVHDDHILLTKNPTYYRSGSVDIDQVHMSMVDASTALTMYVAGELDTIDVQGAELAEAKADPVLFQELYSAPRACTYYYGFSTLQPPFDNLLVRKAFAAATNRQGIIANVTQGGELPALTLTPPGVFGHVDGYAEGVGIPYSAAVAQQWLADAGYPGGAGLPPVTLWFNENPGHQAIAEYLRDRWYVVLGVSITLQSKPWSDYLQGPFSDYPIWRLGWCADYPDAINFLGDGVQTDYFGGWDDTAYRDLLDQAVSETDPEARKAFYQQAEEILVETDAVMLPLYHYRWVNLTKPYLERTYSTVAADIADWQLINSVAVIGASGGTMVSYDENAVFQVPAGAFSDTVILTQSPASGAPPGGGMHLTGHVFDLSAAYTDTSPAQLAPGGSVTISIHYDPSALDGGREESLALYRWDSGAGQWTQQGISSTVQAALDRVVADVTHLSIFALIDESTRAYLPTVKKP